jgi:hypothetical protein
MEEETDRIAGRVLYWRPTATGFSKTKRRAEQKNAASLLPAQEADLPADTFDRTRSSYA